MRKTAASINFRRSFQVNNRFGVLVGHEFTLLVNKYLIA